MGLHTNSLPSIVNNDPFTTLKAVLPCATSITSRFELLIIALVPIEFTFLPITNFFTYLVLQIPVSSMATTFFPSISSGTINSSLDV